MVDEECCDSGRKPSILDSNDHEVVDLANYIGGNFVESNCQHWLDDLSPARGHRIARIPCSDSSDIDAAVAAAKKAGSDWAATSVAERADWLDRIGEVLEAKFDEIAALESLDTGKPISLARAVDATRSVTNFRFFANLVRERYDNPERYEMDDASNSVLDKPVGVCALITPWNLPLYLLSWKVAPALAMGNTIVCKPSELTPLTADLLARVVDEIGLPAGVFNLVHGNGEHAGAPLVSHRDVRAVSFTGGTATGRVVAASASSDFKKLSLELGGKNASIVFADADIDSTVAGVVRAGFLNQGQVCLCGSRILIELGVYEEFRDRLVEAVEAMVIGPPESDETELGALISGAHLAKVRGYIELAKAEGGTILSGGMTPQHAAKDDSEFSSGNWLTPVVIEGVGADSRCATEEIFGPVVTLHPFATAAEAVEIANGTEYGLAASVWSSDIVKAEHVAASLETGMVWINCWLHRDLRVPFGGVKSSGIGREGGMRSLAFFSEPQNICIKHS